MAFWNIVFFLLLLLNSRATSPCLSNDHCRALFTESLGHCIFGTCFECETDTDCIRAQKPKCFGNKCTGCTSGDDCSRFSPNNSTFGFCDTQNGKCLECQTNEDCVLNEKPVCDSETNSCVSEKKTNPSQSDNLKRNLGGGCSADMDCPDVSLGKCGTSLTCEACTSHSQCGHFFDTGTGYCRSGVCNECDGKESSSYCSQAGLKFCRAETLTCEECYKDDHCLLSSNAHCASEEEEEEEESLTCQPCTSDSQCEHLFSGPKGFCSDGECFECSNNNDCRSLEDQKTCDLDSFTCVGCIDNKNCTSYSESLCDLDHMACSECQLDEDCKHLFISGGRCIKSEDESKANTCYQCIDDANCSSGKICMDIEDLYRVCQLCTYPPTPTPILQESSAQIFINQSFTVASPQVLIRNNCSNPSASLEPLNSLQENRTSLSWKLLSSQDGQLYEDYQVLSNNSLFFKANTFKPGSTYVFQVTASYDDGLRASSGNFSLEVLRYDLVSSFTYKVVDDGVSIQFDASGSFDPNSLEKDQSEGLSFTWSCFEEPMLFDGVSNEKQPKISASILQNGKTYTISLSVGSQEGQIQVSQSSLAFSVASSKITGVEASSKANEVVNFGDKVSLSAVLPMGSKYSSILTKWSVYPYPKTQESPLAQGQSQKEAFVFDTSLLPQNSSNQIVTIELETTLNETISYHSSIPLEISYPFFGVSLVGECSEAFSPSSFTLNGVETGSTFTVDFYYSVDKGSSFVFLTQIDSETVLELRIPPNASILRYLVTKSSGASSTFEKSIECKETSEESGIDALLEEIQTNDQNSIESGVLLLSLVDDEDNQERKAEILNGLSSLVIGKDLSSLESFADQRQMAEIMQVVFSANEENGFNRPSVNQDQVIQFIDDLISQGSSEGMNTTVGLASSVFCGGVSGVSQEFLLSNYENHILTQILDYLRTKSVANDPAPVFLESEFISAKVLRLNLNGATETTLEGISSSFAQNKVEITQEEIQELAKAAGDSDVFIELVERREQCSTSNETESLSSVSSVSFDPSIPKESSVPVIRAEIKVPTGLINKLSSSNATEFTVECVSQNETNPSSWSTYGCWPIGLSDNHVISKSKLLTTASIHCECNHTSSYAIKFDPFVEPEEKETLAPPNNLYYDEEPGYSFYKSIYFYIYTVSFSFGLVSFLSV